MNRTRTALMLICIASINLSITSQAIAATTNLTAVADTGLFENNPDNNLGGMDFVTSGTTAGEKRSRALFKFEIANAIPDGAIISSATVSFSVVGFNGFGRDFLLHRMLQSWTEGNGGGVVQSVGLGSAANPGDTTWNARSHPGILWAAGGGLAGTDYVSAASASATMGFAPLVFSSAALADDVQLWLDNPDSNFGWMLLINDESAAPTASKIATRESGGNAPVLTIEYSLAVPPIAPEIFDVALVENAIRFSFNAQSHHSYTVDFTDSLSPTNWTVLTNIAALPEDTTIDITNIVVSGERYFRARTP